MPPNATTIVAMNTMIKRVVSIAIALMTKKVIIFIYVANSIVLMDRVGFVLMEKTVNLKNIGIDCKCSSVDKAVQKIALNIPTLKSAKYFVKLLIPVLPKPILSRVRSDIFVVRGNNQSKQLSFLHL